MRTLGANVAPLDGVISGSVACSVSGDVSVNGSYDTDGTNTDIDLTAAFNACEELEGTLDGSLHWTSSVTDTTVTDTWQGTLDFIDGYGTWTCVFDVTSIVDSTGVHYSGTICGYDAQVDVDL